jgi:hypothetical protein
MGGDNEKWMTLLRDYMIKHHINHTFWCLNTNSGDTEGLWKNFKYNLNDVTETSNGTTIYWEEDKYDLLKKALWQTTSGKFIGLDHKTPLGINGTGISLGEFYSSGAKSNLDAGGDGHSIVVTDPQPGTTTTPKVTTTVTTTTVTTTVSTLPTDPTTSSVTTTTARHSKWGDANCDDMVDVSDAVLACKFISGDPTAKITQTGIMNASVKKGDGKVEIDDVTKILQFIAKLISAEELAPY